MSERYFVGIRHKRTRRCRAYLGNPELSLPHWLELPRGIDWGYTGREPLALAEAMVRAVTDRDVDPAVIARFAAQVVQHMPDRAWSLTEEEVRLWVASLRREVESAS